MGRYEVYRDTSRTSQTWRWRFVSGNGKIIFESSESYRDRTACLNGIALAKQSLESPLFVMADGVCKHTAKAAIKCATVAEAKALPPGRANRRRRVGA